MMKILTKFATVLASLALMFSMVPAAAFADDAGLAPADPGTPTVVTDPAPADPAAVTPTDPVVDTTGTSGDSKNSGSTPLELAPALVVTSATVTNQAEFDTAMADSNITTITVANDFQVTSTLNITRSVTVDGAGHTITVTDAVTGSAVLITGSNVTVSNLVVDSAGKIAKGAGGIQGIQAYQASNVTLDHVTSRNAGKSGIIANGSTVTVINVTTSGNTWHGINVDQGSGVTTPAILTVQGTSTHGESTLFNPAIYIDNTSRGSVTGATDQYNITNIGPAREYNLDPNFASVPACSTDDSTFDTFNLGSVNGQHGWSSTGSFDQAIVKNEYGFSDFGCKSLRISNAVTSGSFGDQTFSNSAANEAGETSAENGGMSGGTRQNHFVASFDIASTKPTVQAGMALSVSPDRGDGARMSYLRFEDVTEGINVYFDDVQGTGDDTDFVETQIIGGDSGLPALSRSESHNIQFALTFIDGPSNDIAEISIDGAPVHTGTTWENYYRYDTESNPTLADTSRTVDSLLFREGVTAVPANSGNSFLLDNVDLSTLNVATTTDTTNGGSGGGSSRRSGSGGGRTTTTSTSGSTGGSVLGAAAFNFTRDLFFGLSGEDVKELQTELIAAGYSIPAGPTGYFGSQTRAAVIKWQTDMGISPAAGYFGPISRAKYAADGGFHLMTTPVTTTATTTSTTTSSM